ncbi:MAG: hypothetical protein KGL39_26985 [Patescibacteria group bacterium]|nr:hypothetical protein [Patescibacteria group bacterium]
MNETKLDWGQLIETALTAPGNLGDTYCRFRTYSYLNQLLLLSQGVMEPVASMRQWNELGRRVIKGSRARVIVRPIFIEKKNEDGEVEDTLLRFKPVRGAFRLSDTEGDDLPPPNQVADWHYDRALRELGITQVPFRELNANVQGYSRERELALNPLAKHPAKTRMHELAHIVLGHTVEPLAQDYLMHRGLFEFGAEGTAFLTLNELGAISDEEASVSRAYVQSWLGGERPSDQAIRQVFSATDKILRAGRIGVEAATQIAPVGEAIPNAV